MGQETEMATLAGGCVEDITVPDETPPAAAPIGPPATKPRPATMKLLWIATGVTATAPSAAPSNAPSFPPAAAESKSWPI